MERVVVLLVVLAITGALSAWWRARDGRVRSSLTSSGPVGVAASASADPGAVDTSRWSALPREAADIATVVAAATPLVLVEFTAPDCRPCEATRTLLDAAVADRHDVSVATLDVGDALDLARAHRIMRAPTTVLISRQGHLLGRVSGVPRTAELHALLDQAAQPQAV